ncbi:MAG: hypothetical protein JW727_00420 [Candidatus Aenigmarchaeota archaeon]|nr:hypothetical protein [Candidatus Aenigmarchaeota archaeon]
MEYVCRMGTLNEKNHLRYKDLPSGLEGIQNGSYCAHQRSWVQASQIAKKNGWTHVWLEPIEGFEIERVGPGAILPNGLSTRRCKLVGLETRKLYTYTDVPEGTELYFWLNPTL